MSYEEIDSILDAWANKHNLNLFTRYQDHEVRSTDIVDKLGQKYQIWIDNPDSDGSLEVHVWDYKKRRKDYTTTKGNLMSSLDAAFIQVSSWINEA